MQSAADARTIAQTSSIHWTNHSFAEKQWKKGLAFVSMRPRFFLKNRSSFSKALIVMAPAADSARWFATNDLVVPFIRINSFAEAK